MRSSTRRPISNHMIDRRGENVIVEEGDRRTWELAGQLVQINNSDLGAHESQIEQWIYGWLTKEVEEKAGMLKNRIELIQKEVMPGHFNLMARVQGKEEAAASSFVYICHMDTVMLGEGWEEGTPVLGAVVREDRLHGRGVYDMKSGLTCTLSVFSDVAELAGSTGELPVWPFVFIGTVDEEDFIRGAECVIRGDWAGREDWILDTEPTDGQIQIAHKGRIWSELTMWGIAAYVSNPWKGVDAIAAMAEAVCHIRRAIGSCPIHEDLGVSTMIFGQITGGYRPYVVSGSCKVWIDMRLVPPTDTAATKGIVEGAVKVAEAEIVGVRGNCTVIGDRPYVEKGSGSRLLASLKSVCDRVTGGDTYTGFFNGYTDTIAIAGTLDNCNCIPHGPGGLELAHKPNEYVPYEDVCRHRRVLTELVRQEAFFPSVF